MERTLSVGQNPKLSRSSNNIAILHARGAVDENTILMPNNQGAWDGKAYRAVMFGDDPHQGNGQKSRVEDATAVVCPEPRERRASRRRSRQVREALMADSGCGPSRFSSVQSVPSESTAPSPRRAWVRHSSAARNKSSGLPLPVYRLMPAEYNELVRAPLI